MQALVNTIKSFFNSLFARISALWNDFVTLLTNIWDSFKDYLEDLPVLIWKQILDMLVWIIGQAASICGSCGSDLPAMFHNSLFSMGSPVLYALNRSGFITAMGLLATGLGIWMFFKVFRMIRG